MFNLGILKESKGIMNTVYAIAIGICIFFGYLIVDRILDAMDKDTSEHNVKVATEATKDLEAVSKVNRDNELISNDKDRMNVIANEAIIKSNENIHKNDKVFDDLKKDIDKATNDASIGRDIDIDPGSIDKSSADKNTNMIGETKVETKIIYRDKPKSPKERIVDRVILSNIHKAYEKANSVRKDLR